MQTWGFPLALISENAIVGDFIAAGMHPVVNKRHRRADDSEGDVHSATDNETNLPDTKRPKIDFFDESSTSQQLLVLTNSAVASVEGEGLLSTSTVTTTVTPTVLSAMLPKSFGLSLQGTDVKTDSIDKVAIVGAATGAHWIPSLTLATALLPLIPSSKSSAGDSVASPGMEVGDSTGCENLELVQVGAYTQWLVGLYAY